ncbi:hypothetical protein TSMEX_002384 [Taenia solium]
MAVRLLFSSGHSAAACAAGAARAQTRTIQAVRNKAFLVNPLNCFLLQRNLDCPTLIAVRLCWHLHSQLDDPNACLFFSLILDDLFCGFGPQLLLYVHERVNPLHRLTDLAISVKIRQSESVTQGMTYGQYASVLVRIVVRPKTMQRLSSLPYFFSIKLPEWSLKSDEGVTRGLNAYCLRSEGL